MEVFLGFGRFFRSFLGECNTCFGGGARKRGRAEEEEVRGEQGEAELEKQVVGAGGQEWFEVDFLGWVPRGVWGEAAGQM